MIRLLMLALIFVIFTSGSVQASETVKGAKKDYQNFKKEMSEKLEAADQDLDRLKNKAKTTGDVAKEKTVEGFAKTKEQLKAELEDLKTDGKSNWQKLKDRFAKSVDELNNKIQAALKE